MVGVPLAVFLALAAARMGSQESVPILEETFQRAAVGEDGVLHSSLGRFVVEGEGALEVMHPVPWAEGNLALRLPGGERKATILELAPGLVAGGTLEFLCQRDGRKQPFDFTVTLVDRAGHETVHSLTDQVNARETRFISLPIQSVPVQVRFEVTAPLVRGVWIDDVRLAPPLAMVVESVAYRSFTRPLLAGESLEVGVLEVVTSGSQDPLRVAVTRVVESLNPHSEAEGAESNWPTGWMSGFALGVSGPDGKLAGDTAQLVPGFNRLPVTLHFSGKTGPPWDVSARYRLELQIGEETFQPKPESLDHGGEFWPGVRITPAGVEVSSVSMVTVLAHEDRGEVLVCAVTSGAGVGLYRSLDGGTTWIEGPAPDGANEAHDPIRATGGSLVYDIEAHRLHLLAQDAQGLVQSFSSDGGATWSPWKMATLESPKKVEAAGCTGIKLSTGELAVPVIVYGGFRIEDEPCAAVLVSDDAGASWVMHHAAFPNTTTSALVEVGPGALLINMNDGRGALRSERTSLDFGRTWKVKKALAASELHVNAGSDGALIHLGRARGQGWDGRMVFANPATEKRPARSLLLKGTSDNASHWPSEHRILLDDGVGVDHPSLAPVGADHVGVAYESSGGGVVFQRLPESVVVPRVVSWFDVTGGR